MFFAFHTEATPTRYENNQVWYYSETARLVLLILNDNLDRSNDDADCHDSVAAAGDDNCSDFEDNFNNNDDDDDSDGYYDVTAADNLMILMMMTTTWFTTSIPSS